MRERNSIPQNWYRLETNQILLCYTYQTYVQLAQVRAEFLPIEYLIYKRNFSNNESCNAICVVLPVIHFLFTSLIITIACSNTIQKHQYSWHVLFLLPDLLFGVRLVRIINKHMRWIVLCVYPLMHHRSPTIICIKCNWISLYQTANS